MAGRKRCALQAVAGRARRGGTLEVATSVTPRRNSPSNRPPRIMASAMSVTNSSSKQSTRVSRAMPRGDALERRRAGPAGCFSSRVHFVHEAVEVQPPALRERQAREEQVHEPGLAAARPPPHRYRPRTGAPGAAAAARTSASAAGAGVVRSNRRAAQLLQRATAASCAGSARKPRSASSTLRSSRAGVARA